MIFGPTCHHICLPGTPGLSFDPALRPRRLKSDPALEGFSYEPLVWTPIQFWWGQFYGPLFYKVYVMGI